MLSCVNWGGISWPINSLCNWDRSYFSSTCNQLYGFMDRASPLLYEFVEYGISKFSDDIYIII